MSRNGNWHSLFILSASQERLSWLKSFAIHFTPLPHVKISRLHFAYWALAGPKHPMECSQYISTFQTFSRVSQTRSSPSISFSLSFLVQQGQFNQECLFLHTDEVCFPRPPPPLSPSSAPECLFPQPWVSSHPHSDVAGTWQKTGPRPSEPPRRETHKKMTSAAFFFNGDSPG